MKKYLLSVVDHSGDSLVCHAYYLSDEHRQTCWDGESALNVNIDHAVAVAREEMLRQQPEVGRIVEIVISSIEMDDGEYYYYSIRFEDGDGDDHVVLLDLDGRVIPGEEHIFQDDDELDRFLDSL